MYEHICVEALAKTMTISKISAEARQCSIWPRAEARGKLAGWSPCQVRCLKPMASYSDKAIGKIAQLTIELKKDVITQ